jgi:hypothetical protein
MEDELGGAQSCLLNREYLQGYESQDLRLPPLVIIQPDKVCRHSRAENGLPNRKIGIVSQMNYKNTGVSFNGRTAVSKTAYVGLIPAAPAKIS